MPIWRCRSRILRKVFKEAGENTVVTLLVVGGAKGATAEKHPALIYDVQKNYLTSEVDHVDFYEVKMDEKLKTHVPLEFVGEASAVRERGRGHQ